MLTRVSAREPGRQAGSGVGLGVVVRVGVGLGVAVKVGTGVIPGLDEVGPVTGASGVGVGAEVNEHAVETKINARKNETEKRSCRAPLNLDACCVCIIFSLLFHFATGRLAEVSYEQLKRIRLFHVLDTRKAESTVE